MGYTRQGSAPLRKGVDVMIDDILRAIDLLTKVPKAYKALKGIGLDVAKLVKAKDTEVPVEGPLGKVIEGQRKRLDKLIDDYYKLDNSERYDEKVKDDYRRRIAASTCDLLKSSQPIKDRIPEYDKLVDLFCNSLPSVL